VTRGILLRVGIVVLIVAIGLLVRPLLGGNAADLQVGECFDIAPDAATVDNLQLRSCTEAHVAEVFYAGSHPAGTGDPYPVQAELTAWTIGECSPAFTAYTGLDPATDPTYSYGMVYPTAETWARGDRSVTCYAARIDYAKVTGSLRRR
jgi:hypothetical protein